MEGDGRLAPPPSASPPPEWLRVRVRVRVTVRVTVTASQSWWPKALEADSAKRPARAPEGVVRVRARVRVGSARPARGQRRA